MFCPENAEITEIIEPSQMAGGFESPKGEKFLRPDGSKRPEVERFKI